MYSKIFAVFLCLTQWIGLSTALNHHDALEHHLRRRQSSSAIVYTGPKVPSYNFSMPVDHFNNADTRTYNNRYWVNDTYYRPGGPVFFFDEGEAGITEQWAARVLGEFNTTSAVMRLAEKYHGVAIMWEHRYYGLSFPVPLNKSTHLPSGGMSGYKYLDIEQPLEDVVYFAKNWKPQGWSTEASAAVSPSNTPWIWIGGSYPGIRAALMRIRNPEIIYASWASSAPVEAMYDGSVYYAPIEASLPSNCSNDIKTAVKYADEIMAGQHGEAVYKNLQQLTYVFQATYRSLNASYNLNLSSVYSPFIMGKLMAFPLTIGFQGNGPATTTDVLCTYLQSYNPNGKPSIASNSAISILSNPGGGAISTKGIAATYDPATALNAYFYAARRWYEEYTRLLLSGTVSQIPPDFLADYNSWRYQVMTQFGWFQASNPANVSIVSKYYNVSSNREALTGLFGVNVTGKDFPDPPDAHAVNKYGGWNMKPSNVMFTDGEFDPWRGGTPMSNMAWNDAPVRQVSQVVPKCNTPPSGTNVFGLVYSGKVHVPDLMQSKRFPFDANSPVYQGLQLFSSALDSWLPCFQKSS